MTAPSGVSSRTKSPIFTSHSTSSASAMPSPTSGSLMTCSVISLLQRFKQRAADPGGSGEVVPFLCVRVGRVPARDAHDRRFQMIEAPLLHERGKLRAKTRRQRRLMDDDAAA